MDRKSNLPLFSDCLVEVHVCWILEWISRLLCWMNERHGRMRWYPLSPLSMQSQIKTKKKSSKPTTRPPPFLRCAPTTNEQTRFQLMIPFVTTNCYKKRKKKKEKYQYLIYRCECEPVVLSMIMDIKKEKPTTAGNIENMSFWTKAWTPTNRRLYPFRSPNAIKTGWTRTPPMN